MIDKNMLNPEYSFTITNDNGIEVVCDTLAVVQQNEEPIIIYTDYTLDKDNKFIETYTKKHYKFSVTNNSIVATMGRVSFTFSLCPDSWL